MKDITESINEARQVRFRVTVSLPKGGLLGVDVMVDASDVKDFRAWCESEIGQSIYHAEDETDWEIEL